MILVYILIFIISCLLLFWSGKRLIRALIRIAKFLNWREFIVAFFVMAFAGTIPNLFLGIDSVIRGIPQLSLGDIVGGNVVDLTLAVALAVLIAGVTIPAESRMIQGSAIFTAVIAVLPLILIMDGTLGRGDGLVLLFAFAFYVFWIFSKEERFRKVYEDEKDGVIKDFKTFIKDLGGIILSLILLLVAAEGIIRSAIYFADSLNVSLPLIGILVVGLGNCLPEIYFAVVSAKRGQSWMILGNLMGSIIVPATLVLGVVALLSPIKIADSTPFTIGRIFLLISAIFFLVFIRSGQKITKKEAIFLLLIYIIFVLFEILIR